MDGFCVQLMTAALVSVEFPLWFQEAVALGTLGEPYWLPSSFHNMTPP